MSWILIIIIIFSIIYFFGWKGFPETIDPDDYQAPPDPEKLLKGAEGFHFKGKSDTAFLLIHGYESTPYTLRGLGEVLNGQGHTVYAPLLPGHGTTMYDLSLTRYEHWYEAIRRVYSSERPKYKKFFIIGFSLGGNLGLRLALQFQSSKPASALILISPPILLNGVLNGALVIRDWRLVFSGIGQYFIGPISKKRDLVSADIINPTVSYTEAYTVPPLHSFRTNIEKIKKYLPLIKLPTCIIQATNDKTINAENAHYILRKLGSLEKRLYLFNIDENVSTRHELLTHERIRDKVIHYIFSFLNDYSSGFNYPSEFFQAVKKRKQKWL